MKSPISSDPEENCVFLLELFVKYGAKLDLVTTSYKIDCAMLVAERFRKSHVLDYCLLYCSKENVNDKNLTALQIADEDSYDTE